MHVAAAVTPVAAPGSAPDRAAAESPAPLPKRPSPVRTAADRLIPLVVLGVPVAVAGKWGLIVMVAFNAAACLFLVRTKRREATAMIAKVVAGAPTDSRVTAAVDDISREANRISPLAVMIGSWGGKRFQAAAVQKPEPGTILVTASLVKLLSADELRSVLGHECAHIWHRPRFELALALAWGVIGGAALTVAYAVALFGPALRAPSLVYSWSGLVALALFGRLAISSVGLAISRHGEYTADRWACRLGCQGTCLAMALWEITALEPERIKRSKRSRLAERVIRLGGPKNRRTWTATRREATVLELCGSDTVAVRLLYRLASAFSTHPSVVSRTRRLVRTPIHR